MSTEAAEMATLKADLQGLEKQLGSIAADVRLLLGMQVDFVRITERQTQQAEKAEKQRSHLEDLEEETEKKLEELEKKHRGLEAEFKKWLNIGIGVWVTASILWALFGKWLTDSIHVSVK